MMGMWAILLTIIAFVFVLGLLIFAHELGHFLTARISKVRVLEFGFGYPPRLLAKRIGDKGFGSECKHEEVVNGHCKQCLRKVVTKTNQSKS